jgi:hypothetical protein
MIPRISRRPYSRLCLVFLILCPISLSPKQSAVHGMLLDPNIAPLQLDPREKINAYTMQ